MRPLISIVIPVKNGMDTLPQAIEGIQKQTLISDCEVVVIDSGSSDGSVEFLSQFPFVTVIPIDPKTFNHGATRNFGVQQVKGEFVVMTVQDALAPDEFWLEKMFKHFKDSSVSGVCGQQVVPHDKNKNPHEWFRPQSFSKPSVFHFKKRLEFERLSGKEKRRICGWDNVNAMYRKKVLEEIPFEKLAFGEDMQWAKSALQQGHKLIYDHTVRVYHYHHQFPNYTYRRALISKVFIYKCIDYLDNRTPPVKNYFLVIYRNFKWNLSFKWIWHNLKIIFYHRKATKDFIKAVNNDNLPALEKSLALDIPIGQQKK